MRNNVGLFLTKRAELNPGLEAHVDVATGRRYSYAELNERTNRLANALVEELGVGHGDRVAILLMNSNEFVETFMACAKIGAVAVPLSWRLTPAELSFMLSDSGSVALVHGDEFAETADALAGRDDLGDLRHWVQVGDPGARRDRSVGYEDLLAAASAAEPEVTTDENDLLYIMYTSGTTGLPKGVMHSHHTVLWAVLTVCATADMRFRDRFLVALPLFHVGALTPVTCNIYKGGTNVVLRTFDPAATWELFGTERVDTTLLVPAMLQFMAPLYDPERHDISRLRWVMSGASPVPVALIERYAELGIEIHQVYGLTESCGPACLISPDEALKHAGSTGKAFFHTDVRVVRPDGTDVAPGEPGEVLVRGEHVMVGYWNRPDATAETIVDGWLHTGDVAIVDDEGYIYIHDRIKDMIISGGENVYPAEIENVILSHPKVADVAVIGQPSERWGESPAAIVVPADDSLTAEEIIEHCRERLARFKLPQNVHFVDEIPRNPSGKPLKRLLRERFPGPAPV